MRWLLATALGGLAGLGGCNGKQEPPPAGCDSWVTWNNFVRPQLETWCTPCHGVAVPVEQRHGAPIGVDFDTLTDARRQAERIGIRALEGTMPPAGGLTDDERARLAEWADCGAPGTTEPAPPDPCADPVLRAGDTVLATDDPSFCAATLAIGGDLTISATAPLDCVCRVDGDLRITGGAMDPSFGQLASVGGSLVLDGAPALATFSAPVLRTVGGALSVVAPARLRTLSIPRLETVGGAVTVSDAPALVHADLAGIVTVGGDLELSRNPALDTALLDRVDTVGGDYRMVSNAVLANWRGSEAPRTIGGSVRVVDNDALVELDAFGRVLSLGGSVEMSGNDAVTDLLGFHQLLVVPGGVRIEDNASLVSCETLVDVVRIEGELAITGNPALAEIVGFAFLEDTGELRISGSPSLGFLDRFERLVRVDALVLDHLGVEAFDGFPALVRVDGPVVISSNPSVTRIDGLSALRLVKGDLAIVRDAALVDLTGLHGIAQVVGTLTIRDNPQLPDAEIARLLHAIDELGAIDVEEAARRSPGDRW